MREFNYAELANKSWDSEILSYVAQIHEFKGRQEFYLKQKPAELCVPQVFCLKQKKASLSAGLFLMFWKIG